MKIRMRTKIFWANLMVTAGCFLLFGMILVIITLSRSASQTAELAQTALSQTATLLNGHAAAIRSTIDQAALDAENVELLNREYPPGSRLAYYNDHVMLENSINNAIYLSNISEVRVITEHGISGIPSPLIKNLSDMAGTRWLERAVPPYDSYFWSPPEDLGTLSPGGEYIAFTRNLTYTYSHARTYYVGFVKRQVFESLIGANITDPYTSFHIVNADGSLLAGKTHEPGDSFPRIVSLVRQWQDRTDAPMNVRAASVGESDFLIGAARIAQTDMTLICTYTLSAMTADALRENLLRISAILLIIFPVVLLLSLLIAFSISKPIERLNAQVQRISGGDLNVGTIPDVPGVEVGTLIRSFNSMLTQIAALLDERFRNGQQIKDMELKALQSQINPHFLYNTLDLIRWKAVSDGNTEIQMIVSSLSAYYRKGLSRGENLVPLKQEAEHITHYAQIQNMRFDNRIQLILDIPEDCENRVLPRLTLQPLVENAIVHGVLEKDGEQGVITVTARMDNSRLTLTVADDGAGMTQEEADRLPYFLPEVPELRSGYGLRNIIERLKLTYKEAHVEFVSNPGQGMAVIISIQYGEGGAYVPAVVC